MQVTVENPGGLQRRLTVQVPGSEVQQQIDARLREIGKTAKLKGFRPGRIPMSVLQQRYGPTVTNEVVGQAMQKSLFQAIQQESLRPASNPVIESAPDMSAGSDLEFTATIEIYPEVGKVDPAAIELSSPDTEIGESDVDDMLMTLRQQQQVWNEVDRAAAEGDQVAFEYTAEVDGETIPESGNKRLAMVIGTTPLDKIEKALGKLKAGEEASVKQKFPDTFAEAALAGKDAKVSLKVASVQEVELPEVNEEFIKSFAIESGDIADMRVEIKNNLERELMGARVTYLKMQLLEALLNAHEDLDMPEGMVRDEATALVQREAQMRNAEPDMANVDSFMDMARKRVKSGLLLGEIARQNDIMVDGARVRKAIETIASTYEQSREVVQMYYNNQQMMQAVEVQVLEEQVVDWMLDNANVKPSPMSFKDLINAAAESRKGV